MRTLAIGDIHGCYRALKALESFVEFESGDRIITLGDYVDRGPDSNRVVEWLIERHGLGQLIALRGNHELMMLAARESTRHFVEWVACGGDAVLRSYHANSMDDIPNEHWEFLSKRLRSHFITKSHFFVHANAYPEVAIDDQPDYMLYWEPFDNPAPHESGLTMVCGHTSQRSGRPRSVGHAICVDTGACKGGWLTCLDVDTGQCWQANESGNTRKLWLDERSGGST